ncbi:hypothetical protein MNBD_NITROSPIRAE01-1653 [hydrothermal vent metagenome]|uniref:GGDEF domain-containing protein n=1 Tax=hydrothermal vent metagenome TaxID=652676 RepID=A0A3B1DY03_9ZZZZ
MSQNNTHQLKGSEIIFLSKKPESHPKIIEYLKTHGHTLQIKQALEDPGNSDVILIEANFSYFSIFKFLKRLQSAQSTTCILLMGENELKTGRISALLRAGVFDYLKHPYPLKRLGKAIRKGLKNRENLLNILSLSEHLEAANQSLSKERDQLRTWNNDLSELYALNQKLSESLHIDEIVKTSISNISKVIKHDISCLYLKKWKQVRIATSHPQSSDLIKKVKEETLQDGLEFIKDEKSVSQALVRHGGSEIMVHLAVGMRKIGLLRLVRLPDSSPQHGQGEPSLSDNKASTPFSEYQAKILSMTAIPLAIAIRNAEMYKQVEDLAVKDALTNVLNRRAFSGILDREFRRASRYNSPLSLMVIDLDHFKKVNDTYGHLVGDTVLRELAAELNASLRDVDVLIRYGGEEFVVILPGTHLQAGLVVANRIKTRVEKTLFDQKNIPIKMTVSIGVAHYPSPQIDSPEALFNQADQALYTAKKNGRNRIMILKSLKTSEWPALAFEKQSMA